MAYDDSQTDAQTQSNYKLIIVAGGVSALLLSIILFIFASNVEARELYHGYYLAASFVFIAGFGVALGMRRYGLAGFAFAVLAIILAVSILKFNARSDINATILNTDQPTIIGTYVNEIPAWEVRMMPFLKTPKWVEFDKECFQPTFIEGASISQNCASKEAIFSHYNISVTSLINQQYNKLHGTAMRIKNEEFMDKASYEGCVSDGFCANVALLPSVVAPDTITETSPEYKEIRTAFWELIDNEQMSVEYCDSMDLCKAMTQIGAVDRRDFQSNI